MTSLDLHQTKSGRFEQFGVLADDFYGEGDLIDGALTAWLGRVPKFQVFQSKVRSLAIQMMDVFSFAQRASKMLFHHLPVDENLLAITPDARISVSVNKRGSVTRLLRGMGGPKLSGSGHAIFVHRAQAVPNIETSAPIHFARRALRKSSFPKSWISGISACLEAAVMGIAMPGSPHGRFVAARDRARDPVSNRLNRAVRATRLTESRQMHRTVARRLCSLGAAIHSACHLACWTIFLLVMDRGKGAATCAAYDRQIGQMNYALVAEAFLMGLAISADSFRRIAASINLAGWGAPAALHLLWGRRQVGVSAVNAIARTFNGKCRHGASGLVLFITGIFNHQSSSLSTLAV